MGFFRLYLDTKGMIRKVYIIIAIQTEVGNIAKDGLVSFGINILGFQHI